MRCFCVISATALLLFLATACGGQKAAAENLENSSSEARPAAVGVLKMTDKDATSYQTIYDFLRGKVPGVQVIGKKIQIRGVRSINAPGDPLILLDGNEIYDISTISPMDVESVQVLKDGDNTIYGMRGVNGVILITTKK